MEHAVDAQSPRAFPSKPSITAQLGPADNLQPIECFNACHVSMGFHAALGDPYSNAFAMRDFAVTGSSEEDLQTKRRQTKEEVERGSRKVKGWLGSL